MSKYFGFVDGQVYDYSFKKHHHDDWTLFYLGEHFICTLINPDYEAGWSVIVNEVEDYLQTPNLVKGFVSRHAAIDYALMVNVKTRDTYHEARSTKIMMDKIEKEKKDS